jgi:hypothetical protein
MVREFAPRFTSEDLVSLPNRPFYIRPMIDGAPSKPFSADLLPINGVGASPATPPA